MYHTVFVFVGYDLNMYKISKYSTTAIITSAKEVVFPSVSLSVCLLATSCKSTDHIFVRILREIMMYQWTKKND